MLTGGNTRVPNKKCSKEVFAHHVEKNEWQQLASLNVPKTAHSSVALGQKVYVIAGETDVGPNSMIIEWLDTSKLTN